MRLIWAISVDRRPEAESVPSGNGLTNNGLVLKAISVDRRPEAECPFRQWFSPSRPSFEGDFGRQMAGGRVSLPAMA